MRRIRFGPLRGMVFNVNQITGMAPWYSGSERAHQRVFQRLLREGDVVLDVGANWGLHTLFFSKLVGPSGLVVALEPYPPALSELEWHIKTNKCGNVKVMPVALSDEKGKATFHPGDSAATGSLLKNEVIGQHNQISVDVCTLDNLIESLAIEKLRLIKIDVEGAESKVLAGASETAMRLRPFFVIDLHTPEQDVLVARRLTSWGYELSRVEGPPLLRTDVGWPNTEGVWGTILATPIS